MSPEPAPAYRSPEHSLCFRRAGLALDVSVTGGASAFVALTALVVVLEAVEPPPACAPMRNPRCWLPLYWRGPCESSRPSQTCPAPRREGA